MTAATNLVFPRPAAVDLLVEAMQRLGHYVLAGVLTTETLWLLEQIPEWHVLVQEPGTDCAAYRMLESGADTAEGVAEHVGGPGDDVAVVVMVPATWREELFCLLGHPTAPRSVPPPMDRVILLRRGELREWPELLVSAMDVVAPATATALRAGHPAQQN